MNEFAIIPKKLAPRCESEYDQKIPKIIWQTMKSNEVPKLMKMYADSWIDLNPEYEYRFCDDMDILNFLEKDFPEYVENYQKLKYGAAKADLWRYLIIYKYGGVYADIDCKCINPLKNWVQRDSKYVTALGTNSDVCQWLIITVPGNPIFLRAAQKTIENSKNNNTLSSYCGFEYVDEKLRIRNNKSVFKFDHPVLGLSGPPVLQQEAEKCFGEGLLSNLLPFTQVVCTSKSKSCEMNGNVRHDTGNEDYKKAYKSMKLSHYNNRVEKLKRKFARFFFGS